MSCGMSRFGGPDSHIEPVTSNVDEYDDLLPQAIEIVVEAQMAAISILQRKLRIDYRRAGRLIEMMAERGIIAVGTGATLRKVLITREQLEIMFSDET